MTSRQVITAYYLIAGVYTLAAALIWGVNTLFLLDAGLDIMEVFIANAAFAASSAVFEIPTGVLADTRGRRVSFLLSVAILFVTTLGYLAVARLGGGVVAFSVVSVLMGLGFTFYSGAVEAWLVDALESTGHKGGLDSVFARGSMITGVAMLLGTTGGGFLGTVGLALPYGLRAVMLVGVFALAFFTMRDLGFTPRATAVTELRAQMRRVARESLTYGWGRRSVRLLLICSFLQMGFLMWGFYAWQPYFLELLGKDAVWVAGVVAALISLSTIVGNAVVDWFSRFCGKRTTLLLWAGVIQTAAAVGVGLAGSFWLAVALFLLVTAAYGVNGPTKQAYLHNVVPSQQRASVVSFDSMMASLGGVFAQTGLGYVSRSRSIGEGYITGGLALVFALPVLVRLRTLGEPADRLEGEDCGCPAAPCAGLGLPEINQVDATPRRAAAARV